MIHRRVFAGCVIGVLLVAAAPLAAKECCTPKTITVTGSAKLKKPADYASFTLGVVTEENTPPEAVRANGEKMQAIVAALEGAGLTTQEYETGQFSIYPVYTQRPSNAHEGWEPKIRAYRVENQLLIHTQALDKIPAWLNLATDKGANMAGSLSFSLKEPLLYRHEAIEAAMHHAKAAAEALAKSAGVDLGKVIQLSLDGAEAQRPSVAMAVPKLLRSEGMTPIFSGLVEVQADVTALFEIKH